MNIHYVLELIIFVTKHKDNENKILFLGKYFKEDIEIANKPMQTCSASLVMWEMHIKTTVRYHYTTIRMA